MITSLRFIPPCNPIRAREPPVGDAWLHEPRLDGYRLQVVKRERQVRLYSRRSGGPDGHSVTGHCGCRGAHRRQAAVERRGEGGLRAGSAVGALCELWVRGQNAQTTGQRFGLGFLRGVVVRRETSRSSPTCLARREA